MLYSIFTLTARLEVDKISAWWHGDCPIVVAYLMSCIKYTTLEPSHDRTGGQSSAGMPYRSISYIPL